MVLIEKKFDILNETFDNYNIHVNNIFDIFIMFMNIIMTNIYFCIHGWEKKNI